jgi:hypothetical protein
VHIGWTEALRELGEQVQVFNLDDRLAVFDSLYQEVGKLPDGTLKLRKPFGHEQAITLAVHGMLGAAFQWWPHVVLVVSAFFVPTQLLDLLRSRGMRVVLLLTESPYQEDEQLNRAAHADVSIVNDPTNLDAYRQLGPAYYQPHCYRPALHHPGPAVAEMASEFCFVGTGFASRVRFLEAMDLDGLNVLLAGNWQALDDGSPLRRWLATDPQECVDNAQTADIYRSGLTSLNLYRREAERPELAAGWAMGPREVELAATGCWFARDPRPEGDELLGMLPTFSGPEEASEQVRWALNHPRSRDLAARQARDAIQDRTFTAAAKRLLELLDRQPVTR